MQCNTEACKTAQLHFRIHIIGEELENEPLEAQDTLRSAPVTLRERLATLARPPKHQLAAYDRDTTSREIPAYRERGLRRFVAPVGGVNTFVQNSAACLAPLVIIVSA
jgi:hypothetical protein